MQPLRLLVFDPGLTTGVAIFVDGTLYAAYTVSPEMRDDYLHAHFPQVGSQDVVVCEDFVGLRLSREAKETLKLIGMLEYICRTRTGTLPVYQRAQARLSFLPEAKLLVKTLDQAARLTPCHHVDAVAHGLRYLYDHPVERSEVTYA